MFAQVLVGAVPLLSIPKHERTYERITEILLDFLTVEGDKSFATVVTISLKLEIYNLFCLRGVS